MVWTIRACAVTLTAVAMVTVAAAPASAISESTIKKECRAANNGKYTTTVRGGTRFSTCTYRDIGGNRHRDYYVDGGYYHTDHL
jgi:hypothetical protein